MQSKQLLEFFWDRFDSAHYFHFHLIHSTLYLSMDFLHLSLYLKLDFLKFFIILFIHLYQVFRHLNFGLSNFVSDLTEATNHFLPDFGYFIADLRFQLFKLALYLWLVDFHFLHDLLVHLNRLLVNMSESCYCALVIRSRLTLSFWKAAVIFFLANLYLFDDLAIDEIVKSLKILVKSTFDPINLITTLNTFWLLILLIWTPLILWRDHE